jgi:hypothetical protein
MLTELFNWSVWLYHNTQIVPGCVKHSQADLYDNSLRDYSAEVMHWVNLRPAQQSSTMHKEAFVNETNLGSAICLHNSGAAISQLL